MSNAPRSRASRNKLWAILTTSTVLLLLFWGIAAVLVIANAQAVPGRWEHYESGGSFASGGLAISPDGARIVFSSPISGKGDIYLISRDGMNRMRLTRHPGYEGFPQFSWKGDRIAFVRETKGAGNIYIMKSDGTEIKQLTKGTGDDSLPFFSPDDSKILFTRNIPRSFVGRQSPHDYEVFIINVDGTNETRITNNDRKDVAGGFSPDGKHILLQRKLEDIYVMDVDGKNARFVTGGTMPSYSRDGKRIVFSAGEYAQAIAIINVDGSDRRQVYSSRTYKTNIRFTPDGNHLLFIDEPDGRGVGWITILDLKTRRAMRIARSGGPNNMSGR